MQMQLQLLFANCARLWHDIIYGTVPLELDLIPRPHMELIYHVLKYYKESEAELLDSGQGGGLAAGWPQVGMLLGRAPRSGL